MICWSILYLSAGCQESKAWHSRACLLQQQVNGGSMLPVLRFSSKHALKCAFFLFLLVVPEV